MTSGRLVLVFDGVCAEVLPVLRAAGVPACFAVITGTIGSSGHLSVEQLDDLVSKGSEIAVHGWRHRRLQCIDLAVGVTAGDDRLYVTGHVFPGESYGVLIGDSLQVTDGESDEVAEVAGTGKVVGNANLDLSAKIDGSYEASETVVRPTEELLEAEIVRGREDLEVRGSDPTTFVFPYDAADVRAWSLARRHCDVIPNASVRSLPNPPGTPLTNLRQYYLETDHLTRFEVGDYLDEVAETVGSASSPVTAPGILSRRSGSSGSSRRLDSGTSS